MSPHSPGLHEVTAGFLDILQMEEAGPDQERLNVLAVELNTTIVGVVN